MQLHSLQAVSFRVKAEGVECVTGRSWLSGEERARGSAGSVFWFRRLFVNGFRAIFPELEGFLAFVAHNGALSDSELALFH